VEESLTTHTFQAEAMLLDFRDGLQTQMEQHNLQLQLQQAQHMDFFQELQF
jgi:hypothetical protein